MVQPHEKYDIDAAKYNAIVFDVLEDVEQALMDSGASEKTLGVLLWGNCHHLMMNNPKFALPYSIIKGLG